MAKVRICVSFDYENDGHLKHLLAAWNAHPDIEFSFDDRTPKEIQSDDYSVIKAGLARKISEAKCLLVIVGKYATRRARDAALIGDINWMNWEINKAKQLKKKLVAVKIDRNFDSPPALLNSGASWAYKFELEAIVDALKWC